MPVTQLIVIGVARYHVRIYAPEKSFYTSSCQDIRCSIRGQQRALLGKGGWGVMHCAGGWEFRMCWVRLGQALS